jgi:hypothetical protein
VRSKALGKKPSGALGFGKALVILLEFGCAKEIQKIFSLMNPQPGVQGEFMRSSLQKNANPKTTAPKATSGASC